jgi:murein L,D-transpeptidase YcbB/YkuD
MKANGFIWALVLSVTASAAFASDEPSYGPRSHELTQAALAQYQVIQQQGGWPTVPRSANGLRFGAEGADVVALKRRLAATGDLAPAEVEYSGFDSATETALKAFQARHGLSETGAVGTLTLRALNVPVDVRLIQLSASLARLQGNGFTFGKRHIVLNIPGASVEAVEDGKVVLRSHAVVGRKDRQSPVIESRVHAVNLNPTWTVPISIVKADIMPKVAKDPGFLAKSHMKVLGAGGIEIDPATIDWTRTTSVNFTIRQDPGPTNSLGEIRLDMPNSQAVFMHDTPKRELFRSDVRFHSSGCARVMNVRGLAAWLLAGTQWDELSLASEIATGERKDIRLQKPVPVAWVYLTAWGTSAGAVHFRDDIYGLDSSPDDIVASTLRKGRPPAKVAAKAPAKAAVKPPVRTAVQQVGIDTN